MESDAPLLLPVVQCQLAAVRQVLLRVSAQGTPLPAAHVAPGQYVKLALPDSEGGAPRTYAIASPPGSDIIELLLKVPEEQVAPMLALGPDDRVSMSGPRGAGFPVQKARGHHLWLFATGSGIGPLRAVLEHLLPWRGEVLDITLMYGVRDPSELAFTDRFGAWADRGVRVVPVVSRPPPGSWDGATGHVQDHLQKTLEQRKKTLAFVCGLPAMDRDVTAQLLQRGVGTTQVFRNW
jgi:NAD(P)H-flavin reductase